MFVQHMIASLKTKGHMATIMPHGVLFRGGKEKLIRELFINDDIVEAIISLPPGLFYGTGIPACVLVVNKNKPDAMRDKILFINADREFAEGKNQNKLRPEDIEKIDYVFTHKLEIPKYSRLVDKSEIAEQHDYNLNIRRYVDNTPDPEPEDVQAHLIGGVPEDEVTALQTNFDRFGIIRETIFQPREPNALASGPSCKKTAASAVGSRYLDFCESIDGKPAIKAALEANPALQETLTRHHEALKQWWAVARDDFAKLRDGKKLPEVQHGLLTTIKKNLLPLNVLDEFKSAGVFVNWWQQIRYDLKTIVSTGWHHSLIPDEYLIAEFFQTEADEIESLEAAISEAQSELAEAVETAQDVAGYEAEEDEKVTATVIKKALKELIDDLKQPCEPTALAAGASTDSSVNPATPDASAFGSRAESAKRELANLQQQDKAIKAIEKRIKETKAKLKTKGDELELKLQLKRLGGEEFKAENNELLRQVDARLAELDANNKTDKRKINALNKDSAVIEERLAKTNSLMSQIGGQLTEEEARRLILKKLYDIANSELNRYLNAEKRRLVAAVENLWDKYAVSSRQLENARSETLETLDDFLQSLGFLESVK